LLAGEKSMNKRIQEMAEEAAEYADYYAMLSDLTEKEIFTEKFAELIVLECAELFEGVYTDSDPGQRIDTRIKQHFGVSE
jgi:hypothetical protein